MKPTLLPALLLLAACTTAPVASIGSRTTVQNVGEGDFLKLRSGPGLEYRIVLGLPDGTAVIRRDCVTELGQRWCQVSLADGPGVTGYVADDYLAD